MIDGKTEAQNIVISIHRGELGWFGALTVDGELVSEASATSAEGVLDEIWDGAFSDDISGDAIYTTR